MGDLGVTCFGCLVKEQLMLLCKVVHSWILLLLMVCLVLVWRRCLFLAFYPGKALLSSNLPSIKFVRYDHTPQSFSFFSTLLDILVSSLQGKILNCNSSKKTEKSSWLFTTQESEILLCLLLPLVSSICLSS
ncbi:hypothetical protein RchiOBHm_Chr2g0113931 [Rosa chinensis]|uniref:Uncharacterized protein n=1 Tax=Rosa chinensis TaxID=74649 RepID=A0A2P6RQL4_ROSCH|nr:hypothetical protein RchiOBHm_Chr2g0113931 [Rosa chinensis]